MRSKVIWLVVSCLMVAVLVLASCGPAEVEEEKEVVTEEEEGVAPVEEEEVVTEEKEMVIDSLGRRVEKPQYGGVRIFCRSTPLLGFDEAYTISAYTQTLTLTHEELITGDWVKGPAGTGEIGWVGSLDYNLPGTTGAIAESWEILDDRTVRFKIRKGIHFALDPNSEASQLVGGREINAHDVVYSLKRGYLTPGAYMQIAHTDEEREGWDVWAEDDWTVIHQWNPELARVIFEYSDFCHIIAEEVIEEYGDMQDWKDAVGTGPFIMVDHVPMSSTTFERNPNYWQKHPLYPEDTMPYLDGVKMLIIPDLSTRNSALRTGKIDALGANWEDAEDFIKNNPELEYSRYLLSGTALFLRMDNPDLPWYDKEVRYALALAINNQEIADELYGGHAEILAYPILPYPAFGDIYTPLEEQSEAVRELFGFNPDKAKQLLTEAGYPEGFQAKVVCTSGGVDTLAVIKDYWAAIGVDLQLDVRDSPVFTSIYFRMKQEEMIFGAPGMGSNQPSKFSNYFGPGYFNHSRITDARVEEVIDEVDGLGWSIYTDFPKFEGIMKPIYPYILEQCWAIPMPGAYSYTFWWPWLKDYHGVGSLGYFNSPNYLNYMWMDLELKKEMGY